MKPLFVRELSDPERRALQAGLRSADRVTVRRCHILLASARGDTAPVIAQAVGCSPPAVRHGLRAFEPRGLAVVALQSRRPHTAAKLFDAERESGGGLGEGSGSRTDVGGRKLPSSGGDTSQPTTAPRWRSWAAISGHRLDCPPVCHGSLS